MMYQHGYISEEERDLAMSTNLAYQLERGESWTAAIHTRAMSSKW